MGVNSDTMIKYAKDLDGFVHASEDVRKATKDMVVAIAMAQGVETVKALIDGLRPKQKDEYLLAIEERRDGKAPATREVARTDHQLQHQPHSPAGKVNTTAAKAAKGKNTQPQGARDSVDTAADQQDFTSCMFCGMRNKGWTENDLDLHYWKECPLLISCPTCAQIVEIAGLPEHLLDECEHKQQFVPCDVTGNHVPREL